MGWSAMERSARAARLSPAAAASTTQLPAPGLDASPIWPTPGPRSPAQSRACSQEVNMVKPFSDLRERLLKSGVAPRHVRRYLGELSEHLADLQAEEMAV